MMMYLKTNNRYEKRKTRSIVTVFVLIILVVATVQFFLPHFLQAFFTSIAKPFWRAEFSIQSGSLHSAQALLNENEALRRELADIKLQSNIVDITAKENEELKELLGRKNTSDTSSISGSSDFLIADISSSTSVASDTDINTNIVEAKPPFRIGSRTLAAVLRRPPFALYDELILDGGADFGFAVGDKVYATGNVPVGFISDVLGDTSRVTLYSSPNQRYDVVIGSSHTPAFASGKGGGLYTAELPRIINIKEGDAVTIPSLDDAPLGIVNGILSDPTQAFETVLFSPPINLYELRWVLVETN
jgi:cell shape-determining protein MreC